MFASALVLVRVIVFVIEWVFGMDKLRKWYILLVEAIDLFRNEVI